MIPSKTLKDKELLLVLHKTYPRDKDRGYAPAYEFLMLRDPDLELLGQITVRVGDDENIRNWDGHIGYGVLKEHRGHSYAKRACRLLIPILKHHQINPVYITCDPANFASKATINSLGAKFIETVDIPEWHESYFLGNRQKCRYQWDLG
ncbi:MAG: GNAT family N-acetyltransferase [Candidatus Cloacimonetes bacterium]|nr:GNAT family N-acetyltransferase [Candidatus Cloacimonadota bacterium]